MPRISRYPLRPEEIIEPQPMNLAQLKDRLQMTGAEIAAVANRSPRSAARWLAADEPLPQRGDSARALRRLAYLDWLLEDVIGEDAGPQWLRTPNPGLRGEAPIDLMTSNHLEDVVAVLEVLADGGPV